MHRLSDRVSDGSCAGAGRRPAAFSLTGSDDLPQGVQSAEGLQKMHKMQKIQKRREFNGLVDSGRPARNMQKMQKFTSGATTVHAPSGNAERRLHSTDGAKSRGLS